MSIRFHHHHQTWLAVPEGRRWQRFHFYRPYDCPWYAGIGVVIWAHEFSVAAVRGEDTPREHRWLCEHVGCTIPGRHAHVPIAVDGRGEDTK